MLSKEFEVREAKPPDKLKPVVSLLSMTPNIVLIGLVGSVTLYWLQIFRNPSGSLYDILFKVFTNIFTFFGDAYSPRNLDIYGIIGLIMLLIFVTALTSIFFMGKTVAGWYAFGAVAYLITGFLTIFSSIPYYVYGYGIGDIFLAGLLFLISFSKTILSLMKAWALSQLQSITVFFTAMTSLALLSMWIDKKQSKIQGARIPEKTLVKYSALGGGIGILVGSIIFKHKTLHKALLANIVLTSASSFYILLGGL